MPKEKVWDDAGLFDLEIGWASLGESVQVGIVVHDGRSIAEWLTETSATDEASARQGLPPSSPAEVYPGRQIANTPSAETPLAQFTSLWATLDRAQINRLIRLLRKARDDSYGRDE